jgi:hypothetical protein
VDLRTERFGVGTPMDQATQLRSKVLELSEAILHKHPTLPTLLREIHSTLQKYPENVTLLPEEDIQVLVRGLEIQTNTYLADSVVSKKSSSKSLSSKLAGLGDDAF